LANSPKEKKKKGGKRGGGIGPQLFAAGRDLKIPRPVAILP